MQTFVPLIVLFWLIIGTTAQTETNNLFASVPRKNFTRSRYSLRNRSTTASPIETTTSYDDVPVDGNTTPLISTLQPDWSTTDVSSSTIEEEKQYTTSAYPPFPINKKINRKCGEQIGDDLPWIVVLEHTDSGGHSSRKSLSKGVLISRLHVLTTVSSVHNAPPFWIVSKVRLGDYPTWGAINTLHHTSSVITADVEEVYLHHNKDIAIIKLARAINFTDAVSNLCLPENEDFNYRELYLHVCKRSNDRLSVKVELKPAIPLVKRDCSIMFDRKGATLTSDKFCAWDEPGDSCTGDLGSPLIRKINGRYHVIGLNSYANSMETFDADDYPGVYTNVGSHLNWIDSILERDNEK